MTAKSRFSAPKHRGRIQVQGKDMNGDPSFSWARPDPVPKAEAILGLRLLRDNCTTFQMRLRDQAFWKAEKFINSGPFQAGAPILRTFQNRNLSKAHKDASRMRKN